MKKLSFLVLLACLMIAETSCKKKEEEKKIEIVDSPKSDPNVKKQLNELLTYYYAVKDALVENDGKTAKYNAGEFANDMSKVDMNLMTEEQKKAWADYSQKLKADAENINKADEVEMQRTHFASFSMNMYAVMFAFKANNETVYQQFCPMAFDNKGGFWLSNSKEIKNPYFGSKMLKCGSVKQEF